MHHGGRHMNYGGQWTSPVKRSGTVDGLNGPVIHIDPRTGNPIRESAIPSQRTKVDFYLFNARALTGEARRIKMKYLIKGYETLTKEEIDYVINSRVYKSAHIGTAEEIQG